MGMIDDDPGLCVTMADTPHGMDPGLQSLLGKRLLEGIFGFQGPGSNPAGRHTDMNFRYCCFIECLASGLCFPPDFSKSGADRRVIRWTHFFVFLFPAFLSQSGFSTPTLPLCWVAYDRARSPLRRLPEPGRSTRRRPHDPH